MGGFWALYGAINGRFREKGLNMMWWGPGVGLLGVVPPFPPLPPPVAWCGFGFSCGGSPCFLSLLWVFGILTPMMIMMKIRTMITIIIIILIISSNILMFLWLVVGCLLPT